LRREGPLRIDARKALSYDRITNLEHVSAELNRKGIHAGRIL